MSFYIMFQEQKQENMWHLLVIRNVPLWKDIRQNVKISLIHNMETYKWASCLLENDPIIFVHDYSQWQLWHFAGNLLLVSRKWDFQTEQYTKSVDKKILFSSVTHSGLDNLRRRNQKKRRTSVGRLWLAPFSSRNLTTSKWFSCAAM